MKPPLNLPTEAIEARLADGKIHGVATPVSLEHLAQVRRCRLRDPDDLVRRLAVELEVQFGLGASVVPVGEGLEIGSPEAAS